MGDCPGARPPDPIRSPNCFPQGHRACCTRLNARSSGARPQGGRMNRDSEGGSLRGGGTARPPHTSSQVRHAILARLQRRRRHQPSPPAAGIRTRYRSVVTSTGADGGSGAAAACHFSPVTSHAATCRHPHPSQTSCDECGCRRYLRVVEVLQARDKLRVEHELRPRPRGDVVQQARPFRAGAQGTAVHGRRPSVAGTPCARRSRHGRRRGPPAQPRSQLRCAHTGTS
jgi:hypothetical protein